MTTPRTGPAPKPLTTYLPPRADAILTTVCDRDGLSKAAYARAVICRALGLNADGSDFTSGSIWSPEEHQ